MDRPYTSVVNGMPSLFAASAETRRGPSIEASSARCNAIPLTAAGKVTPPSGVRSERDLRPARELSAGPSDGGVRDPLAREPAPGDLGHDRRPDLRCEAEGAVQVEIEVEPRRAHRGQATVPAGKGETRGFEPPSGVQAQRCGRRRPPGRGRGAPAPGRQRARPSARSTIAPELPEDRFGDDAGVSVLVDGVRFTRLDPPFGRDPRGGDSFPVTVRLPRDLADARAGSAGSIRAELHPDDVGRRERLGCGGGLYRSRSAPRSGAPSPEATGERREGRGRGGSATRDPPDLKPTRATPFVPRIGLMHSSEFASETSPMRIFRLTSRIARTRIAAKI